MLKNHKTHSQGLYSQRLSHAPRGGLQGPVEGEAETELSEPHRGAYEQHRAVREGVIQGRS